MFKSKLIENEGYYKLRSKQLLLTFIVCALIGIFSNFYKMPIWQISVMILLLVIMIILTAKNQKRINSLSENKIIEIDEKEIRIKSKKGIQQEIIKLNKDIKIILKEEYSIPQETMKEVGKEMTGKTKKNYLILQQNDKKRKLDFEVNSYYMISELNKVIESWKSSGYSIEKLNSQ